MKNLEESYDIVVVGAGLQMPRLRLLPKIMFTVRQKGSNPKGGGSSKGHLDELDALGGEMEKILIKLLSSQRC